MTPTRLSTQRCSLEKAERHDIDDIARLYEDPEVRAHLGGALTAAAAKSAAHRLIEEAESVFVARLSDTSDFAGIVSLAPHHDGKEMEISYQFLTAFWGRGLAGEVLPAVIHDAFDNKGLPHLVAETQATNIRSRRLLESAGFRQDRSVRRFGAEQIVYRIDRPR